MKAGIDQARKDGKPHGRPMTAGKLVPEMKQLRKDGISKRAIAKQLGVSRTSVIRLLRSREEALLERAARTSCTLRDKVGATFPSGCFGPSPMLRP